jgi:hypothetical protein
LLLRRYGVGHWCLIVDADEVLIYPYYESIGLRQLCTFLEKERANAMDSILLDMYPDTALDAIRYKEGTDPLLIAQYFDSASDTSEVGGPQKYVVERWADRSTFGKLIYEGPPRIFGGMRKRVFGLNPCLSKFPLVKFDRSLFLSLGAHFIEHARAAEIRGALLHFKYLHDFGERVKEAVTEGEYWQNAIEYKEYLQLLNRFPDLKLSSATSQKFSDSNQLVDLGIMKTSRRFDLFGLSSHKA